MNNYERFMSLYNQIEKLVEDRVIAYSQNFREWYRNCQKFLIDYYGQNSIEVKTFSDIKFTTDILEADSIKNTTKIGLFNAKVFLYGLVDEIKNNDSIINNDTNIFIVHGHDGELKYKIKDLLNRLGLNPIILHEQTNTSKTIIEKIEKYGSEAQAAIILFTPDDIGKAKSKEESKSRGRQNVVFEAGYFMGLLGRDKTILVVSDNSIELPGDLSGVVYSETSSELSIAKELKGMGFGIDLNKLF